MKKLIFAASLLVASQAKAWEFPGNPDRFPSLGFQYSAENLSGDRAENDLPDNPAIQRTQHGRDAVHVRETSADLRLPVSNFVTFDVGAASISTDASFVRQQDVYTQQDSLSGYRVTVGARLYFNH